MFNKVLNKLGYCYTKQTISSNFLEYLGYSSFILKLGKRSLIIRSVCGKLLMIQYTNGITGRTIIKGI